MYETNQTQDVDGGTPDGTAQYDALDRLAVSDGEGGDTVDLGIPGFDTLPQTDQQKVRDAILSKHNELTRERQATAQEREQYLRAIQALQRQQPAQQPAQETSYEERFKGMTPYQAIEAIAEERAERKFNELAAKMGLPEVKRNTDSIVRELQIIQAKQVYPDLMRHEQALVELGRELESRHGREEAAKIPVLEMMGMLEARGKLRALNGRANGTTRQATRPQQPSAAVSRPGASVAGTVDDLKTKDMGDAFQRAKKMLGIEGEYKIPVNR
jgi:hypothetical protein